jgi:hypothetical protein
MTMIDPWEEAADCERAAHLQPDANRFAVLTHLRDAWIALANQRGLLTENEYEKQLETVSRLQADMIRTMAVH